jgi:hypothetical protein
MKRPLLVVGLTLIVAAFLVYLVSPNSSILTIVPILAGSGIIVWSLIRKSQATEPFPQPHVYEAEVQKIATPSLDLKERSARILRTVPDENAFYFYKRLHYYLDVRARNLVEFLEKLRTIDPDSIRFHISRGDFGNWFLTTLEDNNLARKVLNIASENSFISDENLRLQLENIVRSRITDLAMR